MTTSIYRQGDVLIVATPDTTTTLPEQPREDGRIVLAHGEVTGHAHAILDRDAVLYGTELEDRFLQVLGEGGVDLVHEEHETIHLPPGGYIVRRQREYSPEAILRVAD